MTSTEGAGDTGGQDLAAALRRIGDGGSVDARGVPISSKLLDRLLTAAPRGTEDEPVLKAARFEKASFLDEADFDTVTFDEEARFSGATLVGPAQFRYAVFEGSAWFDDAAFHEEPSSPEPPSRRPCSNALRCLGLGSVAFPFRT